MKKLIIFILLGLLFVACKKKSTVHITAKNAVTGKPYPGLKYRIRRSKTGTFENHYKIVASGTLNKNGEAIINKRFSKNWTNAILLETPGNTCYMGDQNFYFTGGENIDANFEFAECAYLKFRYHNVSCYNQNDHIEVTRITNLEGYDGFKNPAIYNGCEDYTMSDFVAVPMGYWYFTWNVTKNGTTNSFSDTIYLSAGEHKYYAFNY